MDTSVFSIRNPWRSGLLPKEPDRIPRHELQTALSWMDSRHVITIVGPRQAGKSTLMNMLIRHLLSSGKVPAANVFYFTTDDAETVTLLANIGDLLAFIRGNSTGNGRLYLFIDEIQRLESPGLFLKTLYDLDPVSYTHLRAHETRHDLVCRLLLEKKKKKKNKQNNIY